MHHCLTIPEILCLILSFYDVHESKDDKRTVIAIAYTCRSFGHPALDHVWSRLTSLRPLFKCLPEDAWEEGSVGDSERPGDTKMSLKRNLVSEDWARVDFYIQRVKNLSIQDYWFFRPMTFVDRNIFEALAEHYRGSLPLLPNLLHLDWDGDADVYSYISLFLGPQLTSLSFYAPNYSNIPSAALVTSIKTKCPYIRNMRVYYAYKAERPDLFASVSDLIGHCSKLEDIYCAFPLVPTTIAHLAHLKTLRTMHIFDHPLAIVRSLADDASDSLPSNLTIECWDGPSAIQLINTIQSTGLRELTIRFNKPSTFTEDRNSTSLSVYHPTIFSGYHSSAINDSDLTQLFEALCVSFSHLRSLMVRVWPPPRHPPNSLPMVLEPLLCLTTLASLNLTEIRGFELDDDILAEMASAWPSLRHLVMNNRHVVQPKATLRGLSNLLRGCSKLETLWISINVSVDDIAVLSCPTAADPHGVINTLDLGYSYAGDGIGANELGGLVRRLCPKLDYFHVVPKRGCRESWDFLRHGLIE